MSSFNQTSSEEATEILTEMAAIYRRAMSRGWSKDERAVFDIGMNAIRDIRAKRAAKQRGKYDD